MRRELNLFFFLLFAQPFEFCYAQDCSEESLINNFRWNVKIEQQENRNHVIWDDETKESYYLLASSLSIDALRKYVEDPNPVVRSSVFVALVNRNADEKILRQILAAHINDTASFETGDCAVFTWKARDYMQMSLDLKTEGRLNPIDYQERIEGIRRQPKYIIPGSHHGLINKDSLLSTNQLKYSVEGYKIHSFKFSSGDKTISVTDFSSDEVKEMIRNLKPGYFFYIDEIRAELPDKSKRKLPSLQLRISDEMPPKTKLPLSHLDII